MYNIISIQTDPFDGRGKGWIEIIIPEGADEFNYVMDAMKAKAHNEEEKSQIEWIQTQAGRLKRKNEYLKQKLSEFLDPESLDLLAQYIHNAFKLNDLKEEVPLVFMKCVEDRERKKNLAEIRNLIDKLKKLIK